MMLSGGGRGWIEEGAIVLMQEGATVLREEATNEKTLLFMCQFGLGECVSARAMQSEGLTRKKNEISAVAARNRWKSHNR